MTIHGLIAHFLSENNYPETLKAFEREHGTPIEVELPHNESLVDIIQDRESFKNVDNSEQELEDENSNSSKIVAGISHWTAPYPKVPLSIEIPGLVIASCWHSQSGCLLLSTADLKIYVVKDDKVVHTQVQPIGRVVVKKILSFQDKILLAGMNGRVYDCYIDDDYVISVKTYIQAHTKLITDVQVFHSPTDQSLYLITLGWDFLIKVFKIQDTFNLISESKLTVQGTCFAITTFQNKDYVIVGKNEHTLLDIYDLSTLTLQYKISLNDAIFSTSGFSPRCILVKDGIIVVGTSHEPYMRIIIVSLSEEGESIRRNQILRNLNSHSPQDKYSQANIAWRLDKSGVWVCGEDGIIRGINLQLGKVTVQLEGHDGKIKSSCVGDNDGEELFITCGVDKLVKEWKI